ncbi:MAG: hypothetical protein CO186_10410 [Zetaproteobacteria bacterium CG_4_9_14_3_um_filter_49_83]|nr:MAG: hypothetical protein AUJ56_11895 [Zetaproteobacteria bacterium CG1_02_49_23]PIQ31897.1 MAG: hypothetical protein COW62_08755 [Zetaproteobacteria bacterium CG17_big_fil_post_rev_8_21_14_2_50_50_13]PIV29978.1 MAG: hypothetical protein COS35_09110 [Zetaproteobacteria bacterium CG02_land_8_20_14_3_00_50_9]PIY55430.1 MAG: hypothetical protein COZ00_09635 [Zetaproteobacteria bacterium CG_4_10_14_0_8_um_filter_49_80]PJA34555.1 MAG: hypothetical protein CO186_10410 [Zetaproteobacteria bacterium
MIKKKWLVEFEAYKKINSEHKRAPSMSASDALDSRLARWAHQQRIANKTGQLSPEKKQLLDAIDFIWNPLVTLWHTQMQAYQAFVEKHQTEPSQQSSDESECNLGRWAATQRRTLKAGKMLDQRKQLLDEIGFDWNPLETTWNTRFNAYKSFVAKHQRDPSLLGKPEERKLALWVNVQRTAFANKKVTPERVELLNNAGFKWVPFDVDWLNWFTSYQNFIETRQREPQGKISDAFERKLDSWARRQRKRYHNKLLSEDRIQRLNEIGFVWD